MVTVSHQDQQVPVRAWRIRHKCRQVARGSRVSATKTTVPARVAAVWRRDGAALSGAVLRVRDARTAERMHRLRNCRLLPDTTSNKQSKLQSPARGTQRCLWTARTVVLRRVQEFEQPMCTHQTRTWKSAPPEMTTTSPALDSACVKQLTPSLWPIQGCVTRPPTQPSCEPGDADAPACPKGSCLQS